MEAARHLYWQATYAFLYGTIYARRIGEIHEEVDPGDLIDSARDLQNNAYGRTLAQEYLFDNFPELDDRYGLGGEYDEEQYEQFQTWLMQRIARALANQEYMTRQEAEELLARRAEHQRQQQLRQQQR